MVRPFSINSTATHRYQRTSLGVGDRLFLFDTKTLLLTRTLISRL